LDKHVAPILERCTVCHNPEQLAGGFNLTFANIASKGADNNNGFGGRARAYKSRTSEFFRMIESGEMPPPDNEHGVEPLTADEVEIVMRWIDEGMVKQASSSVAMHAELTESDATPPVVYVAHPLVGHEGETESVTIGLVDPETDIDLDNLTITLNGEDLTGRLVVDGDVWSAVLDRPVLPERMVVRAFNTNRTSFGTQDGDPTEIVRTWRRDPDPDPDPDPEPTLEEQLAACQARIAELEETVDAFEQHQVLNAATISELRSQLAAYVDFVALLRANLPE